VKNASMFYTIFVKVMEYLGRRRIINDREDNEPYLERYYVFLKDRKNFPFNVFIHKFLKSDPDDLHNHPWEYRTLILAGGYWEHREEGTYWRRPGSYIYTPQNIFHRVELDKNIPYCWTLFIPSVNISNWGFKTPKGLVQRDEYFTRLKF
tara:strand:+ start:638 stop:1087 length:450 start_codon:yes stop_codon:yes gene_type:complete